MNLPTTETKPCIVPEDGIVPCEPEIASTSQIRLELKPGYAMVKPEEQVQFRTYVVNEDGKEKQVTGGVKYRSVNLGVAQIGSDSGLAYGVNEGATTISAEWQGLVASAVFEVAECASTTVSMLILIDNSMSMAQEFNVEALSAGQLAFNNKLDMAKSMALLFCDEILWDKDYVGVVSFNSGWMQRVGLTREYDDVSSAISEVDQTQEFTDILSALKGANDVFKQIESDKKVIILFSDGVHNGPEDPVQYASKLKDDGVLILSVAIRSHGAAYTRMREIGTAGMFINAHQASSIYLRNHMRRIKQYFCAGVCTPLESGDSVNEGELNYEGFTNWDVATGKHVDLIGGEGDYQFFDFLPGNGLYVDMMGSIPGENKGKISTKTGTISLTSGNDYKVSFYAAGNQRDNRSGDKLRITVTRSTEGDELDRTITINDWQQDFTLYEFEFTAAGTGAAVLAFEQIEIGAHGVEWAGILLDVVTVEEDSGGGYGEIFSDDFDDENPGTWTVDTGEIAGICMGEPIEEQYSDPNKLQDLEACLYGGSINATDQEIEQASEDGDEEEEEEEEASCDRNFTADIVATKVGEDDFVSGDGFFQNIGSCPQGWKPPSDSPTYWAGYASMNLECGWSSNEYDSLAYKFSDQQGVPNIAYRTVQIRFTTRLVVPDVYDGPAWYLWFEELGAPSALWAGYKTTGSTPVGTYIYADSMCIDPLAYPGCSNPRNPCVSYPASITFEEV